MQLRILNVEGFSAHRFFEKLGSEAFDILVGNRNLASSVFHSKKPPEGGFLLWHAEGSGRCRDLGLELQVGRGLGRAALHPHGPGARCALPALRGHARLGLEVVKAGASARRLGDGFVVHAAADTDDHGTGLGWFGLANDN
jgi:hypothetical protein